jgi:hypothetical protein
MFVQCHPDFAPLLVKFDPGALESHPSTVYGLFPDFTIAYFNPAWVAFAADNGLGDVQSRWGLDADIRDALSEPLRTYYVAAYERCLRSGEVWQHEYECSSHMYFRRFSLHAYPLGQREGLLIVNSILVEQPHGAHPEHGHLEQYLESGMLRQCMHCRRVRHPEHAHRWDWVPALLQKPYDQTSHGLCAVCSDYYFGPFSDPPPL